jgi:hypothetical protein
MRYGEVKCPRKKGRKEERKKAKNTLKERISVIEYESGN